MRCKFFTDWCYTYLLTFFIIIFLIYAFLFLVLSPEQTIPFLKTLASYDLNTIIIGTITIIIAIIALCVELRKSFERKVENQIKLIDSLLADLENISSDYSEVYGGEPTKGNLQWYKEQILLKNEMSLDHEINKISYDSYITQFEGYLLTKIKFKKLVRTLSYINDKIREINHHTKELNDTNLEKLKGELSTSSVNNQDKFKEFLKKTIKKSKGSFKEYIVSLGLIAGGVEGTAPLISKDDLLKELQFVESQGIKEVVIYRLGGLSKEYLSVIKKFAYTVLNPLT